MEWEKSYEKSDTQKPWPAVLHLFSELADIFVEFYIAWLFTLEIFVYFVPKASNLKNKRHEKQGN